VQQPICSNKSSHGQPNCKNKIALAYGLNLFVRTAFGDSLKWDRKLNDHVDLQSYVNNPCPITPILSNSLLAIHVGFGRTSSLSFGLRPLGQSSHNLVRLIPNLNDISSQNGHLCEPTSSYHAQTHDNNPNVVTSFLATVTDYGNEWANDGLQMKDSSSPGKQM